ncbi:hypothetical protein [Dendrosporobacter sp. 1207_IL3150]|uniref:hypothetical protein n=1 Tax=Dendrosporobacter sp. 1207_IL3150 TaxID=3084054 RepID=UPI002FD9AD3A
MNMLVLVANDCLLFARTPGTEISLLHSPAQHYWIHGNDINRFHEVTIKNEYLIGRRNVEELREMVCL